MGHRKPFVPLSRCRPTAGLRPRLAWSVALWLAGLLAGPALELPLAWRWANPAPHGNNIIDMLSTNNVVLQVCERGQIYSSVNLTNWVPALSRTTNALRSLCFFNNQFVITGEAGTIVTGDATLNFRAAALGTPDWLEGVAASPVLAVAVGDNAAIYTSVDAANWTRRTVPFPTWLRSVAYGTPAGRGRFVTVGEAGFVATSDDGLRWQAGPALSTQNLNRVAWVNGQFWTVGDAGAAFNSADGKIWKSVVTGATQTLNTIAGFGTATLLTGDGEVRLREGTGEWSDETSTAKSFPAPVWNFLSAFHDGLSFVIGGRTGLLFEGFRTNSTTSPTFWLPFEESVRSWLWAVRRFPGTFIAVGENGAVLTSVDGQKWNRETVPDTAADAVLLGLGGRPDLAVAVGSLGTVLLSPDRLVPVVQTRPDGTLSTNLVSALGLEWTAVPPPTGEDLQGIAAWGNLLVVTGGAGVIFTSPDGTNWTERVSGTKNFLSSVDASSAGLVAAGRNGTLLTSADAVTWTPRASGTTNWIYRVRRFPDRWVAVGQNGTILTSTDGASWTPRTSGTTHWLNDVTLVDTNYFAVGNQGTVLTSSDTVTWTPVAIITAKSLQGAATFEGQLITVGVEGIILRAPVATLKSPVTVTEFVKNGPDHLFHFQGRPSQSFRLDRSLDLRQWTAGPLLEIFGTDGAGVFQDRATNAAPREFFRTHLP